MVNEPCIWDSAQQAKLLPVVEKMLTRLPVESIRAGKGSLKELTDSFRPFFPIIISVTMGISEAEAQKIDPVEASGQAFLIIYKNWAWIVEVWNGKVCDYQLQHGEARHT